MRLLLLLMMIQRETSWVDGGKLRILGGGNLGFSPDLFLLLLVCSE